MEDIIGIAIVILIRILLADKKPETYQKSKKNVLDLDNFQRNEILNNQKKKQEEERVRKINEERKRIEDLKYESATIVFASVGDDGLPIAIIKRSNNTFTYIKRVTGNYEPYTINKKLLLSREKSENWTWKSETWYKNVLVLKEKKRKELIKQEVEQSKTEENAKLLALIKQKEMEEEILKQNNSQALKANPPFPYPIEFSENNAEHKEALDFAKETFKQIVEESPTAPFENVIARAINDYGADGIETKFYILAEAWNQVSSNKLSENDIKNSYTRLFGASIITNPVQFINITKISEPKEENVVLDENNTYYNNIKKLNNDINFNFLRKISVDFVNQLSNERANQLHSDLNGGVAIIETEAHLHAYIHAYGNMHQAKLLQSFKAIHNLIDIINGKNIEIIDYGCGQGIGSIVFIDYLKSIQASNFKISKIKLIDPSALALKRASLNVKTCLKSINQNENILSILKELNDITLDDILTEPQAIKFHILSNIIDVENINIQTMCRKILETQTGDNYFVCVSPKFYKDKLHPRNERQITFMNFFSAMDSFIKIEDRETDIPNLKNPNKPYKRFERVFKVTL